MSETDEDASSVDRVTIVLAGALVVALIVVGIFALTGLGSGTVYTEFYVLGANGTAGEYPENVSVGEEATVTVGIGNFERQEKSYTLVARSEGEILESWDITVSVDETVQQPVTVSFGSPGNNRLDLELFQGSQTAGDPYRRGRVFISVIDNGSADA